MVETYVSMKLLKNAEKFKTLAMLLTVAALQRSPLKKLAADDRY